MPTKKNRGRPRKTVTAPVKQAVTPANETVQTTAQETPKVSIWTCTLEEIRGSKTYPLTRKTKAGRFIANRLVRMASKFDNRLVILNHLYK